MIFMFNHQVKEARIMRFKLIMLILVLFVLAPACQEKTDIDEQSSTNRYLNLDFEIFTPHLKPKWWYVGGMGYEGVIDREVVYSGKASLRLECNSEERQFGVATSGFPIDHARGKKLKYKGMIKTENVKDGYAGLWWRVDGKKGELLAFDNMEKRGPADTTPWRQYVIEMDIPVEGLNIYFGVLFSGTGKAWFDDLQITLDGKPYLQFKPGLIVPKKQDLKWIRANAIPIKTADPIDDNSDLMPLKKLIANRRIVALGEGTHGTSEFFKMKHRITKFLAEEMGFTVFAIEANMPEAREVNRYVLTGEGDPKKALAGLYFWTWNTSEVLEMIKWMRQYNLSGKGKIEFYGFDMQTPTVAMECVSKFVKKADHGFFETLTGHYKQIDEIFQALRKTRDFSKINLEKWYETAKKVYQHLKTNRDIYLKSFDTMEVEWVIQDALVVLQGSQVFMKNKRSRDQSMADNLDWILNHQPPGTKVVTWAHNGHVSKNLTTYKSMGSFLAERHGDDMMVFGFAFHEGEYTAVGKNGINTYSTSKSEPGSVEWYFKSSGIPNFIIDIRGALKGDPGAQWLNQELEFRSIGAMAVDHAFSLRNLTKEFDAIIFFEKTTPSNCFRSKKKLEKQ
jgi:erythromycin esterase